MNPMGTPSKINVEPENDGLEDDYPFPGVYSQCSMLIFRGVNSKELHPAQLVPTLSFIWKKRMK